MSMTRAEFVQFAEDVGEIYDVLDERKKKKLWQMTEFFDKSANDKKRHIANEILKVAKKWRDEA